MRPEDVGGPEKGPNVVERLIKVAGIAFIDMMTKNGRVRHL